MTPNRLPEELRRALWQGDVTELGDLDASNAVELYARALARLRLGRDEEARRDLQRASTELRDVCTIELADIEIRQRTALPQALETATAIAERSRPGTWVRGRAWHIRGLALGKMRRVEKRADDPPDLEQPTALEGLMRALRIFQELARSEDEADRLDGLYGAGAVYDTLGTLFMAEGQLESAAGYYAQSVVEKSLSGDKYGLAITLGGLGRLHLRAGRYEEAERCFQLDLRLSQELGDRRGHAQMLGDLGRAFIGLERYDRAIASLEEALSLINEEETRATAAYCFVRKDLGRALLGMYERAAEKDADLLQRAAEEIDLAQNAAGDEYQGLLVQAVKGRLLLARGERAGLQLLEAAADGFQKNGLPDLEVEALLLLAEHWAERGDAMEAERFLRRARAIASRAGLNRHVRTVREMRERLGVWSAVYDPKGQLDLLAGSGVDGYTTVTELAAGAFGRVFRAFDPRLGADGEYVAIKVLDLERSFDGKDEAHRRSSIVRELEAAGELKHDRVARVLNIGTSSEGQLYVVQEFVDGVPLNEVIRREWKPHPDRVLDVARHIAMALEFLHERSVVHRDLKPDNVILRDTTGRPVLIDFGIAHVPTLPDALQGFLAGHADYISPEQATGAADIDGRTDVYALGAICYEWLAGEPRGDVDPQARPREIAAAIEKADPSELRDLRADLPSGVHELIERMLAADRDARPDARWVARRIAEMRR